MTIDQTGQVLSLGENWQFHWGTYLACSFHSNEAVTDQCQSWRADNIHDLFQHKNCSPLIHFVHKSTCSPVSFYNERSSPYRNMQRPVLSIWGGRDLQNLVINGTGAAQETPPPAHTNKQTESREETERARSKTGAALILSQIASPHSHFTPLVLAGNPGFPLPLASVFFGVELPFSPLTSAVGNSPLRNGLLLLFNDNSHVKWLHPLKYNYLLNLET